MTHPLRPPFLLPALFAALLPLSAAFGQAPAAHGPAVGGEPPAAPTRAPYPGTLAVEVDATDLARRVFRVRQSIPVQAGPLRLLFPKWIPGKHRPDGPIHRLAGLAIHGNGERIGWTRDPSDVYAFDLEVPAGVATLEVAFDMLTPTAGNQGRIVMTHDMLNLEWGTVVLYPAGHDADGIAITPSLKLPAGWQARTDKDAPIGDVADVLVVADLKQFVPMLTEKIQAL